MSNSFQQGALASLSHVETVHFILPRHTNTLGTLFGGQLAAWVDIAATLSAMRHSGLPVMTAAFEGLHFLHPIHVGETISIFAQVYEAFRTSMEVGVKVYSYDSKKREQNKVCCAIGHLIFVALDGLGKPSPVPRLVVENSVDKMNQEAARARREKRVNLTKKAWHEYPVEK